MKTVVLVSADTEWSALKAVLHPNSLQGTPYGETFQQPVTSCLVRFFHSGWGKVASAGGMQYICDQYAPDLVVNLGTCGGFAGQVETGEVILVECAFIYDILELMGDTEAVPAYYTTELALDWLPEDLPFPVRRGTIASADSDLHPEVIATLQAAGAIVADWESAALAWVAHKNSVRLLILRAVSDLVGAQGGEAYGDHALYRRRTRGIMSTLLQQLPGWLGAIEGHGSSGSDCN